jgi:hypothetical protein
MRKWWLSRIMQRAADPALKIVSGKDRSSA